MRPIVAFKRHNVELAHGDIDVYLALKAELIAGLLRGRGRATALSTPSAVSHHPPSGTLRASSHDPGFLGRGAGWVMNSEPVGGS